MGENHRFLKCKGMKAPSDSQKDKDPRKVGESEEGLPKK
jgi:hypothetical protein